MNKILAYLKTHPAKTLVFTVFILLLVGTRLYKIKTIPTGIHQDELMYLVQAKFLSLTGRGMDGQRYFTQLKPFYFRYAELPAAIIAIGIKMADFINLSFPVNYKLSALVIGISLPMLLGLFAHAYFQNKKVAIITAFIAIFNPWLWQISRMSFDSLFSVFFYLVGSIIFLKGKGWKKLVAFPFYFLGFYQYQGMKLLLLPLVSILAIKNIQLKKFKIQSVLKNHLPSLLLVFISLILMSFYAFIQLPSQSAATRMNKIIFIDPEFNQEIASFVDTERRLALNSPLNKIFANKFTVGGYKVLKTYVNYFNLNRLFLENEPNLSPFSVWSQGSFYLIDLLLILVGLYSLFNQQKKKTAWTYLTLILVSPLPAVINTTNDWHMFRGALTFILLMPVIALGIYFILGKKQKIITATLATIYGLSIIYFSYQYFVRYPSYSSSGLYLENTVMNEYLGRNLKEFPNRKMKIFHYGPFYEYVHFLYDQQLVTKENANLLQQKIAAEDYSYKNIQFLPADINHETLSTTQTYIIESSLISELPDFPFADSEETLATIPRLSIVSALDSGETRGIFGDQLCQEYKLKNFVHLTKLEQLEFDRMSNKEFCQTWITNQ